MKTIINIFQQWESLFLWSIKAFENDKTAISIKYSHNHSSCLKFLLDFLKNLNIITTNMKNLLLTIVFLISFSTVLCAPASKEIVELRKYENEPTDNGGYKFELVNLIFN